MRALTRFFVLTVLLIIFTSASNVISHSGAKGDFVVTLGVPLMLIFFALLFPNFFLRQQVGLAQSHVAFIEIGTVMAVLALPVFVADLRIDFEPFEVALLGPQQVVNTLFVLAAYLLTLSLGEKWGRAAIQISLLLYLASIILDLVTGGLFGVLRGDRPGGFLVNANDGASLMDMLLVAALPWRRPSSRSYFWAIAAFVGIAVTLSRSGLILWFLIVATYAGKIILTGRLRARILTIGAVSAVLAGFIIIITLSPQELYKLGVPVTAMRRVEGMLKLAQGQTSVLNGDSRVVTFDYWVGQLPEHPLMGNGSGYAMSGAGPSIGGEGQGPHNMYFARFIDGGIVGILSILAFFTFWGTFFLVRRDIVGIIFITLFALTCMFSHNVADYRPMLSLLGFLAAEAVRLQGSTGFPPVPRATPCWRAPKAVNDSAAPWTWDLRARVGSLAMAIALWAVRFVRKLAVPGSRCFRLVTGTWGGGGAKEQRAPASRTYT